VVSTPQININWVPVASFGTLVARDFRLIRHIALSPQDTLSIVRDLVVLENNDFPVIEFRFSWQFRSSLPYRIAFPPNHQWGVAEFNPKILHWPSFKDPLFVLFQQAFQNYLSCPRHASHETTDRYHRCIFRDYSQLFGAMNVIENDQRVNLYSGNNNSCKEVEQEIDI
jgi:hypothetical protein